MKNLTSRLKLFAKKLNKIGINPENFLTIRNYPLFRKQRKEWLSKNGAINKSHIILYDYEGKSGNASGHYFHQDLLVANMIFKTNPKRHVDVGSRMDGFVAHVASFREIEVLDIRPQLNSIHKNIQFRQADLLNPHGIKKTKSLSCLHVIEHLGLGRYTDKIDIDGHIKGIESLVGLVQEGGRLYLSFPIGLKDEVHFNAHRVLHPQTIFTIPAIANQMYLLRFDYVDDEGNLHLDSTPNEATGKVKYGCGIYTLEKLINTYDTPK